MRYRPDIVFTRGKVVCEVMGCLWHRCPDCSIATPRSSNGYWEAKLQRNVERDERNARALENAGWTVVYVWEHEDAATAADRVEQALVAARARL
jgi:DNA mismatch endonuclease (patch repair protein)